MFLFLFFFLATVYIILISVTERQLSTNWIQMETNKSFFW